MKNIFTPVFMALLIGWPMFAGAQTMTPQLATIIEKATNAEKGDAAALASLQAQAKNGDVAAQTVLGSMYSEGKGVKKSDEESVRWFREAAEQGFPPAQLQLGTAYQEGHGVAKDLKEAANWTKRAAEQDYREAQHELGTYYMLGIGVKRDYEEAFFWNALSQGATAAHGPAMSNEIADHLSTVQIDVLHKRVIDWREQAAKNGHRYNLAGWE